MRFSEAPDAHLSIGTDDVAIFFEAKKRQAEVAWRVIFDQEKTIRVERQVAQADRPEIAETQDPGEVVAEVNGFYGYRDADLDAAARARLRLFARACEFIGDNLSEFPKGLEIHVPRAH